MVVRHKLVSAVQKAGLYPLARALYNRIQATTSGSKRYRKDLGEILSFQNVPVVPYESLIDRFNGLSIHHGGPIWPDWSTQTEARHCRDGSPSDDLPSRPNDIFEKTEDLSIWGGAICTHFGHQIADFSTRILQSKTAYPNAQFLFSAKSDAKITTIEQTPPFFRSILDWYDLKPDQVKIVSQPLLVRQLLVAPQAEQLSNCGPSSEYLDLMDAHVDRKLTLPSRQGTVFVSRAGLKARFAGEFYLEQLMQENGIKIIRPETMPLKQQLAEYSCADRLIFSEGSAVHGLQLLGRSLGEVQIINRRPRHQLAKNALKARAKSLAYVDLVQGVLHGFTTFGTAKSWNALTVLKEEALVDYLHSLSPKLKQHWNHSAYIEHRDRDVLVWIDRERQTGGLLDSLSDKQISRQLRSVQLAHLIPSVLAHDRLA
ncbi:MAG: hypothetical protein DCF25_04680 [Leptolyngbya foveolarum]|uniref:Glycosyltransferase 61 catalytic domain-containing protein n=1 Tax=Leptolyngbya foveolarum TaxID=47253 RepID=A0A2W4WBY5_9CYAN|nr:MAG: hypothetical protein DCF25_04680 [Leptolyngbya foveolarum]